MEGEAVLDAQSASAEVRREGHMSFLQHEANGFEGFELDVGRWFEESFEEEVEDLATVFDALEGELGQVVKEVPRRRFLRVGGDLLHGVANLREGRREERRHLVGNEPLHWSVCVV